MWLPTGGYIVINQTEALVAIDVNTGRFVGKNQLEETILKTNLEAVREIVRQIRLRDLGGIIVVDFIDMEERKSRQKVLAALEQELRKDRSPTKLLSVNEFGLVILTRKRVKQSLERCCSAALPVLLGQRAGEERRDRLLRDLRRGQEARPRHAGPELVLRVNPEVARALEGEEAPVLKSLTGPHRRRAQRPGRRAAAPRAVRRGGGLSEPVRDPELDAFVAGDRSRVPHPARQGARARARATSRSRAPSTRPGCRSPRCSWRSTRRSSTTRGRRASPRAAAGSRSFRRPRPAGRRARPSARACPR